jgi:hypothetical protein
MVDLLDNIRKDMAARMTELRPLVDEHNRLDAAFRALGESGVNAPSPRAVANSSRKTAVGPKAAPRHADQKSSAAKPRGRKRAARGANRHALLSAVADRPGASSAELAAASGIDRNTLNGLLSRLVKDGQLQKRDLPAGRIGFALSPAERETS